MEYIVYESDDIYKGNIVENFDNVVFYKGGNLRIEGNVLIFILFKFLWNVIRLKKKEN